MRRRSFLAALAAVVVAAKRGFANATGLKREWIQYVPLSKQDWVETELLPTIDMLARSASPDDDALFPRNPDRFQPKDIVHCPRTGENFRVIVVAIGGGAAWQQHIGMYVTRGIGSVPCTMVEGEPLWILGSAYREGDTSERTPEQPDEWGESDRQHLASVLTQPYQRGAVPLKRLISEN
jgi:hypothetical protein